MKLVFVSDIHGSAYYTRMLPEIDKRENPERIVLLGDLLYHGPRNDLPRDYAPKEVISILNSMKQRFLCVRGNCEAEVDQMVLEFPVMADYMALWLDGRMAFVTHGHLYNLNQLPNLNKGDLLIHGHTHVQAFTPFGQDNWYINPGSASIPKEDNDHSYMTYEDGVFTIKSMDGSVIKDLRL